MNELLDMGGSGGWVGDVMTSASMLSSSMSMSGWVGGWIGGGWVGGWVTYLGVDALVLNVNDVHLLTDALHGGL